MVNQPLEAAMPDDKAQTTKDYQSALKIGLILVPVLFYVAALNPYFLPNTYDDIVYYFGAASIAEEGGFKFEGKYISDWPPGFSAVLALIFRLSGESVWVAKAAGVACVAGGLILGCRYFQSEKRPFPLLTFALFALLPSSFMMGTRIMTEWPYFLISVIFLQALAGIRNGAAGVGVAIGTGLLLGAAALTKFTGVLLGAAVLAQAIDKWKRLGFWSTRAEAMVAFVGAAVFLAWKAKIQLQINLGTATEYEYYRSGLSPVHVGVVDLWSIPGKITDLLFHSEAVMGHFGWNGPWAALACAIPGLFVLIGMVLRFVSGERTPGDWYVLSLLGLLASAGTNHQTRYLMPVAPFLISYGFLTGGAIKRKLPETRRNLAVGVFRVSVAAWLLVLCGSVLELLFVGNLSKTHRGLFFPASPTAEAFYRGPWLELYQACQQIKSEPVCGEVAVIGGQDSYVPAFAQRHCVPFKPAAEFAYLLVLDRTALSTEKVDELNLRLIKRYESLDLYRK